MIGTKSSYKCTISQNIISFLKQIFIYLKSYTERASGTEKEREGDLKRDQSSIHWFTPLMGTMARAGPGRTPEPGVSTESPIQVIRGQTQGILHCFFQVFSRELNQSGAAVKETGMHWDAGIANSAFTMLGRVFIMNSYT